MLAALLLAAAAGAAWLSVMDRTSPAALTLVEWEGRLGQPVWLPLLVAAVAAMAWRVLRRVPKAAPPQAPVARDPGRVREAAADAFVGAGDGWADAVRARARKLPMEPLGQVRFDEAPNVPFTLLLRSASPEQARRRIALFAEFLGTIPTPPGARVRLESCPDIPGPIHKLVGGEVGRHFAAGDWQVTSLSDGADLRFSRPDPRWAEAPR